MKSKSENKKHLIFRNLILFLTLLVCIFIAVIAWFTSSQRADANGLNIECNQDLGLQASFSSGTGYNYQISRALTENFKFPLITGDGTDFFLPALNRSDGSPLTASDGSWLSKRAVKAAKYATGTSPYMGGDYYEEDIWFKGSEAMNVYLAKDSAVSPIDTDSSNFLRKSDYGNFSKDNIAGASRVAFFQVADDGTETPVFTWIPNDTYQLTTSDNMTPIKSEEPESTGAFNSGNADETFGLNDTSKYKTANMYMWELLVNNESHTTTQASEYQMYQALGTGDDYIGEAGSYLGAITLQSSTQLDHGIIITSTDYTSVPVIDFGTNATQANSVCAISNDAGEGYVVDGVPNWVGAYFDQQGLNASPNNDGSNVNVEKLTVDVNPKKSEFFSVNDRFQILFEYNPSGLSNGENLKVLGFVFYNSSTGTINGGAGINPTAKLKEKYILEAGSNIVITNNTSSLSEKTYAINALTNSTNTVNINMASSASGIVPYSPLTSTLYSVSSTTGGYTLSSVSNGRYLKLDAASGKVVLVDNASSAGVFTVETGNGGPMLKSDGYYISFANGGFSVSNTTENATLRIYQGSAFAFRTDGISESESGFYYYKSGTGMTQLQKAASDTYGYLLTSDLKTNSSGIPVTTLTKVEGSYMSHIRVRIWAEGTDREAKIPLAGGIFSTSLHFLGVPTQTN